MTTPDDRLAADIDRMIRATAAATRIAPSSIASGSSRASGHVAARHAVFYLLHKQGHSTQSIATAFRLTRQCVDIALKRMTMTSKAWLALDAARRELGLQPAGNAGFTTGEK